MNLENKKPGYVIDTQKYSLGNDTEGVEHFGDELQKILLDALLEFDRVCRKNNIPYALAYGSALGIYNYGGFIPWDDDVDIAINYEDIPRIVEACKKDMDKKFVFECYENNKKYNILVPTGKIRILDTYFKEKNWFWLPNKCKSGQTLFLDVVAFMGVPENQKEHQRLIRKAKMRVWNYVGFDVLLRINPFITKKVLKRIERKTAEKYKDSPVVSQTVIIPFQDGDGDFLANAFPRDVIYPFREYDFCGHKIFSFNDIEKFCLMRFGEKGLKKWDGEKYIDPYPVEKRQFDHLKEYNLNHHNKK